MFNYCDSSEVEVKTIAVSWIQVCSAGFACHASCAMFRHAWVSTVLLAAVVEWLPLGPRRG